MRKRKQVNLNMWRMLEKTRGTIGDHQVFMRALYSPLLHSYSKRVMYKELLDA